MANEQPQHKELETRVSLIERDMSHMVTMFDKLDTSIEKMTEIHQDMRQILSVHEQRLNDQEITDKEIYNEIKELRSESTEQHNELRDQIVNLEKIRWMIIGAGVLLTYAATAMDFFN